MSIQTNQVANGVPAHLISRHEMCPLAESFAVLNNSHYLNIRISKKGCRLTTMHRKVILLQIISLVSYADFDLYLPGSYYFIHGCKGLSVPYLKKFPKAVAEI